MVVRQLGNDPIQVDSQIAEERKREAELGIITDTNANEVLIGKESQPKSSFPPANPNRESDQEADENDGDN
jgi:capsid protein